MTDVKEPRRFPDIKAFLLTLRDYPDEVVAAAAVEAASLLTAQAEEVERLRLAICGGEDAPGYAASLTLDQVLAVADENERRCREYSDLAFDGEGSTWKARAIAAECGRSELEQRLREVEGVLKEIANLEPATQEMTLAHQMAQIAEAALTVRGEMGSSGSSVQAAPGGATEGRRSAGLWRTFDRRRCTIQAYQFTEAMVYAHLLDGEPLPEGVKFGGATYHKGDRTVSYWRCSVRTMHDQVVYLADGDWIVREPVPDRYYPVKPEVFEARYCPADTDASSPSEASAGNPAPDEPKPDPSTDQRVVEVLGRVVGLLNSYAEDDELGGAEFVNTRRAAARLYAQLKGEG